MWGGGGCRDQSVFHLLRVGVSPLYLQLSLENGSFLLPVWEVQPDGDGALFQTRMSVRTIALARGSLSQVEEGRGAM